jgi:hypothetical protein
MVAVARQSSADQGDSEGKLTHSTEASVRLNDRLNARCRAAPQQTWHPPILYFLSPRDNARPRAAQRREMARGSRTCVLALKAWPAVTPGHPG